jgi:DNA-binding response OmpR family regulator
MMLPHAMPKRIILIVEDDPTIVDALRLRLESSGFGISIAVNAAQAIASVSQTPPDLALLDISLPEGDGLALAGKLRDLPATRSIPLIFITASKDPRLRAQAMRFNAAGFCEKPYDGDELLALIQFALGDGSSFKLKTTPVTNLPVSSASTPASHPSTMKNILIIEDDRNIATALALRMKQAGYAASVAHDALAGVSAAAKLRPDLVLLDITMPAGNGFYVAERIQALVPTPTPIIFMTASKDPSFRQRAETMGAIAFIEKPYVPGELLRITRATLGPKHASP